MSSHGVFITIEGGEGSGKSTLLKGLAEALQREHIDPLITHAPGGSGLGQVIRKWLLSPESDGLIGERAELLLFLADRAQHLEEVILPALEEGRVVLCDRFNDSTIAYQGVGRGLGLEEVEKLCEAVCRGVHPDLTLLLDLEPELGLRRARQVGEHDRLEQEALSFHTQVREGFSLLARRHPDRIVTLDASQSPEEVLEKATQIVMERCRAHHRQC